MFRCMIDKLLQSGDSLGDFSMVTIFSFFFFFMFEGLGMGVSLVVWMKSSGLE